MGRKVRWSKPHPKDMRKMQAMCGGNWSRTIRACQMVEDGEIEVGFLTAWQKGRKRTTPHGRKQEKRQR